MSNAPKILYIDDEEDLVSLAESFFSDEKILLETTTSFHDALEKIRGNSYDLIISDARMPSGSGLELLRIVRQENSFQGKFILVTGNVESFDEGESQACDMVIYKPLRFQELIEQVKKLLSMKL